MKNHLTSIADFYAMEKAGVYIYKKEKHLMESLGFRWQAGLQVYEATVYFALHGVMG